MSLGPWLCCWWCYCQSRMVGHGRLDCFHRCSGFGLDGLRKYAVTWEDRHKREYWFGERGKACDMCTWRQFLAAEYASATRQVAVSALLDLHKAYEHVSLWIDGFLGHIGNTLNGQEEPDGKRYGRKGPAPPIGQGIVLQVFPFKVCGYRTGKNQ